MRKKSFGFLLLIGIFILILSSCNVPFQSQIISEEEPTADTSSAEMPEEESSAAVEPELEPPHNVDGAELTLIPAATFQMGSAATDSLADADEFPQHQVSVDEFYLYTYEVTNQMYAACVEAGYCMSPQSLEEGPSSHYADPEFGDNPVVGVDWVMARDYCAWAGGRLPTEAEWELASRGPESYLYPWGEESPTCDYVNMGGCFVPPDTQQVGYYLLGNSPDEVWDLSGNVWEWVHDWYADDYYSQSPAYNPIGPLEPQDPENPQRVIRGGGLNSVPEYMRSAARKGLNPYRVFVDVGFRCVMGEGLVLPAAYDPGVDRHERVPPGSADEGDSGDDPEEPEPAYRIWMEDPTGPCPDGSGVITLHIPLGSTPPPTSIAARDPVTLGWWDESCEYDAAAEIATCIGPEPADYMDPPPTFPLDICVGTGEWAECIEGLLVNKPTDCGTSGVHSLRLGTDCEGILGAETGIITIELVGAEADFSFATVEGMLLTCSDVGGGIYHCSGLPGSPGDDLDVVVTLSDGSTMTGSVVFPDCGGMDVNSHWILSGVGCLPHEGSAWEYYAVIDTFLDVEFSSWRLEGVEAPKLCTEDPIVGRWYCNFAVRDWYTTLTFCATWDGGPGEVCQTFPESQFGALLPGGCYAPQEYSCSDFTTETACNAHAECLWTPKAGPCVHRP